MKEACKQCPFRTDSNYRYDADASQAMDDGEVPACHMIVGVDAVFHHAPLLPKPKTECVGHTLWLQGTPGYSEPDEVEICSFTIEDH